ncbi:MAG: hypothetical protein HYY23_19135 [Verrucomicrobia bacterium]|nr:hypothetical protein [Verrucomicrobiota bacterium]
MNVMTRQDEGNTQRWCKWFVEASVAKAVEEEQATPSLEAIANSIRKALPVDPTFRVDLNRKANVVVLTWYGQQFAVTTSQQVFQLQGTKLLITGPAMLIQAVIAKQEKTSRAVGALLDSIEKSLNLIKVRRFEAAYALLEAVKNSFKN